MTELPLLKEAEQVAPQLMPVGELVTVPDPVPARVTETGKVAGMKLAVTAVAAVIVTEQVPTPEHPPPLQPANTDAADVGEAVSVTTAFCRNVVEHVAPQLMPAGELVTVPLPAPVFETVSENVGVGENVAVTAVADVPITIVQVPVPEQPPPLHPVN